MKNENGITLIELLAAIVIVGIVLVPLLTVMTGSFTRTVAQGKDTQLSYYGQEVMEIIREQGYEEGTSATEYYCLKDRGCVTIQDTSVTYDAKVTITADPDPDDINTTIPIYEITIEVESQTDSTNRYELVTVVKDL
ncbi:prepilin-type N-terminal cleavage/methylation domain-containing protein [Bacillus mesophilus]|uniref:Type II secretion system protein n=1 Tax=Bacillus mesophilus TaxID=1808955 RepID=A0A6M0Q9R6_9BACI|nr:type II secretion system protein [Bacillus mesophilus]MBM7662315.1 prepilin-type N-terminal cleavage/methylation domain-containing protein [Bacillus mesophilus]NEY73055.1 type II secretion system protein [Bacillus mesophilus]